MFFSHTAFSLKFYLLMSCHMHAAFYIIHPLHPNFLHHSNHFWCATQTKQLFTMQNSPNLLCFHPLKSKHSTQHSFSKTMSPQSFLSKRQSKRYHYSYFNLYCLQITGRKAKDYEYSCSKHYITLI